MALRMVAIPAEDAALLDAIVETGLHGDAAGVLGQALRMLHARVAERDALLEAEIARGVMGLEGSTLTEGEVADLDQFLDGWAAAGTPKA